MYVLRHDLTRSSSIVIESNYSGILHYGECRASISNLVTILCLYDWSAFDLSYSLSFISLLIYICLLLFLQNNIVWTLYIKKAITHLNSYLREITRSSEPFMGYTASFLYCEFGFIYVLSLYEIIVDKFFFGHKLAYHLFTAL